MPSYKPVRLQFKFYNFADLPYDIGVFTSFEEQTDGNGNTWRIHLFPGGGAEYFSRHAPYNEANYMALSFQSINMDGVDAAIHVTVRDGCRKEVYEACSRVCNHGEDKQQRGYPMFHFSDMKLLRQSDIVRNTEKYLIDSTLHLDVCIQVIIPDDEFHKPPNPVAGNMIALYESRNGAADVSFNVDGETFQAYSQILLANAPILADLCKENALVTVSGVIPEAFDLLMRYIYCEEMPAPNEIVQLGKELIECSNKFEVVGLKLAVETHLVQSRVLNKNNVADYLVFADAKVCPLLKEYAILYLSSSFMPKMFLTRRRQRS